ncbi:ArsR/SmtB family transcription factor [Legionella hackeliae]|uniref:Transcriptional regulator, ArsR family n=1 Tax=Legionella hackeliae TaxID=449 RepID=A0A0A8UKP9_LEGHA|nr:metalloregulator ArsR/SmtB family transcription factor [Legionella hackeliae]KTD13465.1 Helix-turn-helix domain protein [Legionella hackeliae]CEK09308.1 Transcriptional regulator, ArsR family [Legionella hackeliae]STX49213.1 Arsenical resistance operon repressor [Legionella hackeliae]
MLATKTLSTKEQQYATVFAALGDKQRLSLVKQLTGGRPLSISQLTQGSNLTRQAITKHLKVLQNAGVVHRVHLGRESLFELNAEPFKDMKDYLAFVVEQWELALNRLKAFIENDSA